MTKYNAKVFLIEGNKKKKTEPAEHIMKFPGGSISVARVDDDTYWAHIEVNMKEIIDGSHRESKLGEVVETRLDYDNPPWDTRDVDVDKLYHVAVKIKTN